MIRVAILGAGIGAEHLTGYRALPDRFEVATLCDLDLDRARVVTAADSAIRLTGDIDAVLADPDIGLVDVCLPPHLHARVAIAALEAGKHVICEKPLARSLSEVDAIGAAMMGSGKMLFPVFQYRFGPAFAALDALVEAGLAGPPVAASLETHWNRDAGYYAVPWRGTWAGEAGGAVLGHAIHSHDLLCRFFGPVAVVQAQLATLANPIETDDCAAIALRFANGSLATSSVTLGAARDETRMRLVFRDLTATSDTVPYSPATGVWRFDTRHPERQEEVDRIVAAHSGARPGFAGYLDAVAESLAGRASAAVSFEDGRASIELVTAIYASARTGEAVSLPLGPAHPFWNGWQPERTT
ncbi:Gfo/Idh/MocA family oxidoreductase [Roseibacterium sp. SDUM158017]|uniref:Gfo/Idh/MocA family protein n=1 Tax=Roseicyclus salinarum TaxID=3036773 RepID=UPI0024157A1B|nr:Gfo/Idh/MocA family oxidoreductase [Roseibacterium sp. SDUM158017]MDG4646839.1 Gfo/Idh/MocA family oxidoreductase [Roseibacterium sp. SDUM158017]